MRNEPARPSFLPPPLPVEQRVGGEGAMVGGNGVGRGDLLGPLGSPVVLGPVPPGRVGDAGGELRLLGGQGGREGGALYGILGDKEILAKDLYSVLQEKVMVGRLQGKLLETQRG